MQCGTHQLERRRNAKVVIQRRRGGAVLEGVTRARQDEISRRHRHGGPLHVDRARVDFDRHIGQTHWAGQPLYLQRCIRFLDGNADAPFLAAQRELHAPMQGAAERLDPPQGPGHKLARIAVCLRQIQVIGDAAGDGVVFRRVMQHTAAERARTGGQPGQVQGHLARIRDHFGLQNDRRRDDALCTACHADGRDVRIDIELERFPGIGKEARVQVHARHGDADPRRVQQPVEPGLPVDAREMQLRR